MTYDDVLFHTDRGLGRILLNRPRAINALDHEMVRRIDEQLIAWADDDGVGGVVITGAGERGLCAGGDIVSIHHDARRGGRASIGFWRDEYVLNARIDEYPKPYLAVMDGIVMGGGVGVSAHGSIRLVTERTSVAMPEVGIGLIPDVGGSWLLAHAPGQLGTHLALTGDRFGPGDAIVCGFADRYLPSAEVPGMLARLDGDTIGSVLTTLPDALPHATPDSPLQAHQGWIDQCYSADSVLEILRRLRAHPDAAAGQAADLIATRSPVSTAVTLRALRQARRLPNLRAALEQELRMSAAALDSHDLIEGIRAQVIDKDRRPRWSPQAFEDVTAEMVERYFLPVHEADLPAS